MRSLLLITAAACVLATAPLPAQVVVRDSAAADSTPKPLVARPSVVRGLYVSRWAAIDRRMWDLIDVAKRTEVNALVIDVKDDRGYVLYRSSVPLARAIGADTVNPMPIARLRAVLDTMRANGILPIARIVVAKDPLLASARREWAVKRRSDGTPWLDQSGNPWLDPHQRGVWTYAADLAAEAVKYGFSEVQFDYVRFPDDPRLIQQASFALANGRSRDEVIHEQLGYLRSRVAPLGVPMAIDVFGLTTSDSTDMGIGQRWEQFAPQTDIVLPMTYPSHYSRGMYDIDLPNAHPYEVIDRALTDALERNRHLEHPPQIVPWYQDFTLGAPPYGAAEIRAQIQAGYDHGVRSWMLWNAGSSYTVSALRPAILSEAEEAPNRRPVAADSVSARRAPRASPPPDVALPRAGNAAHRGRRPA